MTSEQQGGGHLNTARVLNEMKSTHIYTKKMRKALPEVLAMLSSGQQVHGSFYLLSHIYLDILTFYTVHGLFFNNKRVILIF